MLAPSNLEVFDWLYAHLGLIGWPTLFVGVWKVSKWVNEVHQQFTKTVDQIDTLATNHFPHFETSLQKQDQLLESVDGSLKTLVERQSPFELKRDSTVNIQDRLLESVDTSLKILVERQSPTPVKRRSKKS